MAPVPTRELGARGRRKASNKPATGLQHACNYLATPDALWCCPGVTPVVHQLTVKIDAARREAVLYRDQIIPRSQSALDSARSGWEANCNTFRDVLDARRMLLEGRLMQARAVAEQYQMLSELVLCCGLGDMEALQMIGAQPEVSPAEKANPK
jgi:hypothetical protein